MTPDLNHSIAVHNTKMAQWWATPEYIIERKAFVARNPICARCGRPATTPGHSHEDYSCYAKYLIAVITDKCEPLCSACNLMEKKRKKPCPECVKQKKEKIHYIPQDQEMCFYCLPVEVQDKRKARVKSFKRLIREMQDKDNARRREVYQKRKNRGITAVGEYPCA
jgi:hypothetical protein